MAIHRKALTAIIRGLARFPDLMGDAIERLAQAGPRDRYQEEAISILINSTFDQRPIDAAAIDLIFPPEEMGWRGFVFKFLDPKTHPDIARSDLRFALEMMVAAQQGMDAKELIEMQRNYRPPIIAAEGKLI